MYPHSMGVAHLSEALPREGVRPRVEMSQLKPQPVCDWPKPHR